MLLAVGIHLGPLSIPLVYLDGLCPPPCSICHCGSAVWFEMVNYDVYNIVPSAQDCSRFLESFVLPNRLRIVFLVLLECNWNFDEHHVEFIGCFWYHSYFHSINCQSMSMGVSPLSSVSTLSV